MSYSIEISHLTATSCMIYIDDDGAAGGPQNLTFYQSDGTTAVKSISVSDPGWDMSVITVNGLTPNTTYVVKLDDDTSITATFTTLTDEPKTATESQWQDLANRVKAKSDVQITMTSTDPGEGAVLAADNYIAVYGGDPIIMDYSTNEVNTGAKWIDSSAIYKKTISLGHLPDTSTATVAHNIVGLLSLVKLEGYFTNGTNRAPLPYPSPTATKCVQVYVDSSNITIVTGEDRSAYTGYLTLYYTRSGV